MSDELILDDLQADDPQTVAINFTLINFRNLDYAGRRRVLRLIKAEWPELLEYCGWEGVPL